MEGAREKIGYQIQLRLAVYYSGGWWLGAGSPVNPDGTLLVCQAFATAVKNDKTSRVIMNISSGVGVEGIAIRLP